MIKNSKPPIIAILGKTSTGKSTIEKRLKENDGINSVVSLTTRPKREGEVDGVDYHFVSDNEFDDAVKNQLFYEQTSYNVNGVMFRYGFLKGCFDNGMVNVATVNPRGLKELCKHQEIRDRLIIIMLKSCKEDIVARYLKREGSCNAVKKRLKFRLKEDRIDFGIRRTRILRWFKNKGKLFTLVNDGMDGVGLDIVEREILEIISKLK